MSRVCMSTLKRGTKWSEETKKMTLSKAKCSNGPKRKAEPKDNRKEGPSQPESWLIKLGSGIRRRSHKCKTATWLIFKMCQFLRLSKLVLKQLSVLSTKPIESSWFRTVSWHPRWTHTSENLITFQQVKLLKGGWESLLLLRNQRKKHSSKSWEKPNKRWGKSRWNKLWMSKKSSQRTSCPSKPTE